MFSNQHDFRPPWYKDSTSPLPFLLAKKINSNVSTTPFRTIAFFPWGEESLKTLWNGSLLAQDAPDIILQWKNMISKWSDAVAVGGHRCIYVFFIGNSRVPMRISLPQIDFVSKPLPTDAINIAWTIQPGSPLEPLLIFSESNLLYIYNVRRKGISGFLRGHGGAITSVAVHPINTNIFCTTSRDYSVRIYDLNYPPKEMPSNPPWPPASSPSLAGAPHGLHMSEPEGTGIGQCIAVLMGGRSGGHQAAVLGAAFHSQLPLIATCGLDRMVKIWFVPGSTGSTISREDKPLFSSSKIHKASVRSISWLSHDILLTHCTSTLIKIPDHQELKQIYDVETGQIVVWRWLGMERFFPSGEQKQIVLRGCASDYQESASFKIISAVSLPKEDIQNPAINPHLYHSPTHDPIILFTKSSSISIFNVVHLEPCKPRPFPSDEDTMVKSTQRPAVGEKQGPWVHPEIPMWILQTRLGNSQQTDSPEPLMACAMGKDGSVIVGVDGGGTLLVWMKQG